MARKRKPELSYENATPIPNILAAQPSSGSEPMSSAVKVETSKTNHRNEIGLSGSGLFVLPATLNLLKEHCDTNIQRALEQP